jgi:hypothetical protein
LRFTPVLGLRTQQATELAIHGTSGVTVLNSRFWRLVVGLRSELRLDQDRQEEISGNEYEKKEERSVNPVSGQSYMAASCEIRLAIPTA